jgi:hypothetical protein
MYARVAQFESDASSLDQMVNGVRESLDRGREAMSSGEGRPEMEGLEGVRRVMMLIDRDSGRNVSVILCDTEDDLRKADEALNKMTPEGGARRSGVGLYEVAIDREMR